MMAVSKSRRIDRIDGRTVLFLTLCACLVTFLTTSFLGHGIFTLWICLILCWFGLFRQAIGCFSIYMVALVWLLIEMKYKISVPSPLLLSMVYKLLLPAMAKGYSARGGFSGGGSAMRQQQMQQKLLKMQQDMAAAQEAVENASFTASVGGGVVQATVSGKKELTALTVKPEAVDPEDVEMLQDLVISAVNEALRQADEAMNSSMQSFTGGLNLPGFGL